MAELTPALGRLGRKKAKEPENVYDNYDDDPKTSWAAKLDSFAPTATAAAPAKPATPAVEYVEEPSVVYLEEAKPATSTLDDSLSELINFEGAMSVALVDSDSGMILGRAGKGVEMDLAAAGASVMLKARRNTIKSLGLSDEIDDLLVTLSTQLQIIRPLSSKKTIFLYMVVDRARSSLAMARFKATEADAKIVL